MDTSSRSKALSLAVQTNLGKELADIVLVARDIGMPERQLQAAILGRTGVCASSWPNDAPRGVSVDPIPQDPQAQQKD